MTWPNGDELVATARHDRRVSLCRDSEFGGNRIDQKAYSAYWRKPHAGAFVADRFATIEPLKRCFNETPAIAPVAQNEGTFRANWGKLPMLQRMPTRSL